jgi:hypothetical protein
MQWLLCLQVGCIVIAVVECTLQSTDGLIGVLDCVAYDPRIQLLGISTVRIDRAKTRGGAVGKLCYCHVF